MNGESDDQLPMPVGVSEAPPPPQPTPSGLPAPVMPSKESDALLDNFIANAKPAKETDVLDSFIHDSAPHMARQILDDYKAGKHPLDNDQVKALDKVAQNGVSAWTSLGRATRYIFSHKMDTLKDIGSTISKGYKGAEAAGEELTAPERQLASDLGAGHPIDALWNYGINKFVHTPVTIGEASASGIAQLAPALGGATAEAAELAVDPFLNKAPRAEFNARLNAGVYQAQNLTNRARDRIGELTGVNTGGPLYSAVEQTAPILLPAGGARAGASLTERAANALVDQGTRIAGKGIEYGGKAVKAAAPLAVAGALYKSGHAFAAAGELFGIYGFSAVRKRLIDIPFNQLIDFGKAMSQVPDGETLLGSFRQGFEDEAAKYQQQLDRLKSKYGSQLDDAFEKTGTGEPLYDTDKLKGKALEARLAQEKITDLNARADWMRKGERYNRFASAVARTGINIGLDSALAGGIGTAYAGSTESTGEYEQAQKGLAAGAAIGLAARAPTVPLMVRGQIRQFNRGELIRDGAVALPQDHPGYDADRQERAKLSPEKRDYINLYSGVASKNGSNVVLLPEKIGPGKETRSPWGYYDPKDKTAYIDPRGLLLKTVPHEISHALAQASGWFEPNHPINLAVEEMLNDKRFTDKVQKAKAGYDEEMGMVDPGHAPLDRAGMKEEIIADLASDIFSKETPEGLYGGRSPLQKASAALQRLQIRPTQTSYYKWPVTPDLRNAVADALFQAGEKAAQRGARPTPAALSPEEVQARNDAMKALQFMRKDMRGIDLDNVIQQLKAGGRRIDANQIISAVQRGIQSPGVVRPIERPPANRILGPALVDPQGNIIEQGDIGDHHTDLLRRATEKGKGDQALQAFQNDAQHVFVDANGDKLNRQAAAPVAIAAGQAPPGVTELQAHHLENPAPVSVKDFAAANPPEKYQPPGTRTFVDTEELPFSRRYMPGREEPKETQFSEKVVGPSIRVNNIPFTGRTYEEAEQKARDFGFEPNDIKGAIRGFNTNKGRFLNPDEAADFTSQNRQMGKGLEGGTLRSQDLNRWRRYMPGREFYSPNQGDLTFDQAVEKLNSPDQEAARTIAKNIQAGLGLNGQIYNALGNSSYGSENSLISKVDDYKDFDQLRYAAALKGMAMNQKAVLAFEVGEGPDSTHTVKVPETDLATVRNRLSANGIEYRSMIPEQDGTTVMVFDLGNKLGDNMASFAKEYGSQVQTEAGRGEFVGESPTREEARSKYQEILSGYESSHPEAAAQGIPGNRRAVTDLPVGLTPSDTPVRGRLADLTPEELTGHGGRIILERAALMNYDGVRVNNPDGSQTYYSIDKALVLGNKNFVEEHPPIRYMPGGGFYSQLERTLEEKMPNKASADQVLGILKGGAVKKAELEWNSPLRTLLDSAKGPLTKDQVITAAKMGTPVIEEKVPKNQAIDIHEVNELAWQRRDNELRSWSENYYPEDVDYGKSKVHEIDRSQEEIGRGAGTKDLFGETIQPLPQKFYVTDYEGDIVDFSSLGGRSTSYYKKYAHPEDGIEYDGDIWDDVAVFDDEGVAQDYWQEYHAQPIEDDIREEAEMEWLREHPIEDYREEAAREVGEGGEDIETPKYELYTIRGGENYRELLLKLANPKEGSEPFTGGHFEPQDVVSHLRLKDRVLSDKTPILFMEESQSDWAQQGRERGFAKDTKGWTAKSITNEESSGYNHWEIYDANGNRVTSIVGGTRESAINKAAEGLPDMPFKGEAWKRLNLRTAIQKAVEEGKPAIGWTTGEQQIERYPSLGHYIDQLDWVKQIDGKYQVTAMKDGRMMVSEHGIEPNRLHLYTTKNLADQILKSPNDKGSFTDQQLNVPTASGAGMKVFYDQEMVNLANDIGKKYGARVVDAKLGDSDPSRVYSSAADGHAVKDPTIHLLPITDALRKAVQEQGQPLFMPGGEVTPEAAQRETDFLNKRWTMLNAQALGLAQNPNSAEMRIKVDQMSKIMKRLYELKPFINQPKLHPGKGVHHVIIIGGGPGGLSAAINNGHEGLDSVLIEAKEATGGQAAFTSRIQNYAGFPGGISGPIFFKHLHDQASRYSQIMTGRKVTDMDFDPQTGIKTITLDNGEKLQANAVVIASGLEHSELNFPGRDTQGIIYMDGMRLKAQGAGKEIAVIGGSNGAAQAALGAAPTSKKVYVISRSPLSKKMSATQIQALRSTPNIEVIEGDRIQKAVSGKGGNLDHIETVEGRTLPVKAAGFFVGSAPDLSWAKSLQTIEDLGEEHGKIKVDSNLQTNIPGVFAIGDIRQNSGIGIQAATGDGQIVIKKAYKYIYNQKHATETPPASGQ